MKYTRSSTARLVRLRAEFLDSLLRVDPESLALYGSIRNYEFILGLVPSRKAVRLFAKYIYLILCLPRDPPVLPRGIQDSRTDRSPTRPFAKLSRERSFTLLQGTLIFIAIEP